MAKSETREVKYVCTQCQSEDRARLYANEPTPVAINCWRCHAGMSMGLDAMVEQGKGMFPVGLVADDAEAVAS